MVMRGNFGLQVGNFETHDITVELQHYRTVSGVKLRLHYIFDFG